MTEEEPETYIRQHNIEPQIKAAIKELLQVQPIRPFAFLRDFFGRFES